MNLVTDTARQTFDQIKNSQSIEDTKYIIENIMKGIKSKMKDGKKEY